MKFGVDYQTFDIGFLYHYSKALNIGFMIKNVYRLSRPDGFHSGVETIDPGYAFYLPRYYTIGISKIHKGITFSMDNEVILGEYGGTGHKEATFWFLRSGIEKKMPYMFIYRVGVIIPIIARTDTMGDLRKEIPFPKMGGSLGIGVRFKKFSTDFAIYGDPGMSYAKQEPRLQCMGTLKVNF